MKLSARAVMSPLYRVALKSIGILTFLLFISLPNASAQFGKLSILGTKPNTAVGGALNKALDQQVGKLLGQELPLTLNAGHVYTQVNSSELPGGPFVGTEIKELTPDMLVKPLPPGDYVLHMTFFCSEYGAHQPNEGMAYILGPAEGKLSTAIATLLWRGMMVGKRPQELQMISWAIQGSVPYSKMPPEYQKTIDALLPDFKNQLDGQGFSRIKNGYDQIVSENIEKVNSVGSTVGKALQLGGMLGIGGPATGIASRLTPPKIQAPSLDTVLGRLGPLGQLALDGEKQASLISGNYIDEEKREQTVFAGQGTQAPPQPAANGPWSRKTPGVYMRFVVKGGNLTGSNEMQIRVLPQSFISQHTSEGPHFQLASYQVVPVSIVASPSLLTLMGGASDEAILARCVLSGPGYPECVALSVVVAGVVSYEINKAGQAPLLAPTLPITSAMAGGGGNGGSKKAGDTGKEKTPDGTNGMEKEVQRGQAPKSIDRVDKGVPPYEKDHIHFTDDSALNNDGTWKHGGRSLSNAEKKWITGHGWRLPVE